MAEFNFYDALSGIGDTFAKQRQEATRREALAGAIGPDGQVDFQKAILGFAKIGDTESAARMAAIAGQNQDRQFRQQEAVRAQGNTDRSYDLQQKAFNRKEDPESVRTVRAAGIDPTSLEGRKVLFPKAEEKPMGASEINEIIKSENAIPALDATIANIKRAKELNPNVYTGFGASTRGAIGAKGPDWIPDFIASPEKGKATAEWEQLMGGEGIKNMSETLKGASTDFEMKKFLSMSADTTLPADVRQRAMDRFLSLAEQEKGIREKRIEAIKNRTFTKPAAPAAAVAGRPISKAQYDALPSGETFTAPDGSQRVKP